MGPRKIILFLLVFWSVSGSWAQALLPSWRIIASDQGRHVELDMASIRRESSGMVTATSRLVMSREVSDTRSGGMYQYIQATSRYDCQKRTTATLLRSFIKANGEELRADEIPNAPMAPVRSSTLDDSVLRELCRPLPAPKVDLQTQLARIRAVAEARLGTAPKPGQVATVTNGPAQAALPVRGTRPATPVGRRIRIEPEKPAVAAPPAVPELPPLCVQGQRQSPIDIRDGIPVDLETIQFDYRETLFTIVDTGETLEVKAAKNRLTLLGKAYDLERLRFYRPSMEHVQGQGFAMSAHLEHIASDGERLIVSILLEEGSPNEVVQTLWNHIPLEKNQPVSSPTARIDLEQLLPEARGYHTYMGSLPYPPCTEGVIWVVLQTPVSISPEQNAIFARLYPNNARAPQPANGRLIKSSRSAEESGNDGETRQGDASAEGG